MTKTVQLTVLIGASIASAQSAEALNNLSLEQFLKTSLTEASKYKQNQRQAAANLVMK